MKQPPCSGGAEQSYRYHIKAFIDGAAFWPFTQYRSLVSSQTGSGWMQSDKYSLPISMAVSGSPNGEDETRSGWSSLETGLDPALREKRSSFVKKSRWKHNCGCE
jgi:hypothetical protein